MAKLNYKPKTPSSPTNVSSSSSKPKSSKTKKAQASKRIPLGTSPEIFAEVIAEARDKKNRATGRKRLLNGVNARLAKKAGMGEAQMEYYLKADRHKNPKAYPDYALPRAPLKSEEKKKIIPTAGRNPENYNVSKKLGVCNLKPSIKTGLMNQLDIGAHLVDSTIRTDCENNPHAYLFRGDVKAGRLRNVEKVAALELASETISAGREITSETAQLLKVKIMALLPRPLMRNDRAYETMLERAETELYAESDDEEEEDEKDGEEE